MESFALKGLSVGPHKIKKSNFAQNPSDKKVMKTKKFRLNELPMECFKFFDMEPKLEVLQPQNLIFGVFALQAK